MSDATKFYFYSKLHFSSSFIETAAILFMTYINLYIMNPQFHETDQAGHVNQQIITKNGGLELLFI